MVVVLDLFIAKLVAIVWLAVTLVKVYDVTAPTDVPSTVTSVSVYPGGWRDCKRELRARSYGDLTRREQWCPPVPAVAVIT